MPGGCRYGTRCRYSHVLPEPQQPTITTAGPSSPPSIVHGRHLHSRLTYQDVRSFDGAFVFFDNGAEVSKVIMREEWSAVLLCSLPAGSTAQSVLDLIDEVGYDLQAMDAIWSIEMSDQSRGKPSALVIVNRTTFATRFVTRLEAWKRTPDGAQSPITMLLSDYYEHTSTSCLAKSFRSTPIVSTGHLTHEMIEGGNCVVCLDDAPADAIRTKCGLAYCLGCFTVMCQEEAKAKGFIACCGQECKARFSIEDLQLRLYETMLDYVLYASFKAHISRNQQVYAECPGKNCKQVYRKDKLSPIITCRRPKNLCNTFFCTKDSCNDRHPNISCSEWKKTDAYKSELSSLQDYMRRNNTKKCPGCGEGVELKEACNHIDCPRCGQHFCFRCLAKYETSAQVYDHMKETHNNYYGDEPAPGVREPPHPGCIQQ
jgi:predicted RNA-binding Zn-ribbon protein involved in translation (DUF1610 family)